jgi:alpha/beta superfamily hydrolase
MANAGEMDVYKGFRIAILHEGEKYIAWIESSEPHALASGYSFGQKISTNYYDDPKHALAAAMHAIDTGEVKVHV